MSDKIADAIAQVRQDFPFPGYMDSLVDSYYTVGNTLARHLAPGATILDFGAGPCDKTAVAQHLGYKCSAADDLNDDWHMANDNRSRILAFTRDSGIEFRLLEDRTLPFAGKTFDMVMMHDVLEHLHDSPRELLNQLLGLVKEEGLFFTTVPSAVNIRKRIDVMIGKTNLPNFDGFYWYPGPWRGHVREYTRGDLERLSVFLNLDILELGTRHHMIHKLSPALRPIYRAVTVLFPDWRDTWLLVARKRPGWQAKTTLPPEELKKIFGADCPHYLYQH